MDNLNNELPSHIKQFFEKVQTFVELPLYFYGSVTRSDYVPGKSDIDVAIFTDNEASTISRVQGVVNCRRDAFEKIVWKLNGTMIYGYKLKCEAHVGINCEIAIYNNDFKEVLIDEFTRPMKNITVFIKGLIYLLKLFHYTIPIIPKPKYVVYKRYILNDLMVAKESVFFVLKPAQY
jgi:tRNA nucleotidyltransferase (CCA-adding enzyme)